MCLTTTKAHVPHGIIQYYWPPGRGDILAFTMQPITAGTRFSNPQGCNTVIQQLYHLPVTEKETMSHGSSVLSNTNMSHGKFFIKKQNYAQNASKYVWQPGSTWTDWGSFSAPPGPLAAIKGFLLLRGWRRGREKGAVSYTHLTLPTILRV